MARLATTTQQNDQLSSLQRIVQAIPWPVIDANFADPTIDGLEVSNQAQLKALDSDGYTRDSTTVSQRFMPALKLPRLEHFKYQTTVS